MDNNNLNSGANTTNPVAQTATQHDPWTKNGVVVAIVALLVGLIPMVATVGYYGGKIDSMKESIQDIDKKTDSYVTKESADKQFESIDKRFDKIDNHLNEMATKKDIELFIQTRNTKK